MEQQKRPSAPGLEWRGDKPRWRATKAAIAKGYTPKNRELPRDADAASLIKTCERFNGRNENVAVRPHHQIRAGF